MLEIINTMDSNNIDPIDEQLRKLLHEQAPDVKPNPWFTHRVLHRLPARRAAGWVGHAMYVVAIVILAGMWLWMAGDISVARVITVGDLLQYVAVLAVTLALLLSRHRELSL